MSTAAGIIREYRAAVRRASAGSSPSLSTDGKHDQPSHLPHQPHAFSGDTNTHLDDCAGSTPMGHGDDMTCRASSVDTSANKMWNLSVEELMMERLRAKQRTLSVQVRMCTGRVKLV